MNETQTNFEFEEYPDLNVDLTAQLLNTKRIESTKSVNEFDPYQTMIQKKKMESGEIPIQKWPEKDIKALETFCKDHVLIGISCGRMSPVAVIALLKQKLGIIDEKLEERVPYGYQRIKESKKILFG